VCWKGAVTLFCRVQDIVLEMKAANDEEHLREKHAEAANEATERFQKELNTSRQRRHWSGASSAPLVGGIQMS